MQYSYHPNGRIRGAYVYLLMCAEGESIYAKIGKANDPVKRLHGILTACPLRPEIMAVAELQSEKIAFIVEQDLHRVFARWRHTGEWFRFTMADKTVFNAASRTVFGAYASASWPIRWKRIPLRKILATAKMRRRYFKRCFAKYGPAYRDFMRLHHTA